MHVGQEKQEKRAKIKQSGLTDDLGQSRGGWEFNINKRTVGGQGIERRLKKYEKLGIHINQSKVGVEKREEKRGEEKRSLKTAGRVEKEMDDEFREVDYQPSSEAPLCDEVFPG